MRYIKKITEYQNEYDEAGEITSTTESSRMVEYSGYAMGASWMATHGWMAYDGTLPLSRLDIVDGAIVELPEPEVVPEARIISKLKLRDALPPEAWEQLKTALESAGEYERFILAHDVTESDPGFVAICDLLRPTLTAAGIDLDELLNNCIMERY